MQQLAESACGLPVSSLAFQLLVVSSLLWYMFTEVAIHRKLIDEVRSKTKELETELTLDARERRLARLAQNEQSAELRRSVEVYAKRIEMERRRIEVSFQLWMLSCLRCVKAYDSELNAVNHKMRALDSDSTELHDDENHNKVQWAQLGWLWALKHLCSNWGDRFLCYRIVWKHHCADTVLF